MVRSIDEIEVLGRELLDIAGSGQGIDSLRDSSWHVDQLTAFFGGLNMEEREAVVDWVKEGAPELIEIFGWSVDDLELLEELAA